MLACSDSPFGKYVFDTIKNLYEWESGSHECSRSAAHESHKPTTNTPRTWGGFEISQNARKKLCSSTCHDIDAETENSKITPFELSALRALNGQMLWLGMPLTLLMGQPPQATVDTIYEVNKLARKATVWKRTPLKVHAHHSPVVVTYTDAGWTTRPGGTSQGGQLVFIANSELLQGKESNMSLISWHSSRLRRVARYVCA